MPEHQQLEDDPSSPKPPHRLTHAQRQIWAGQVSHPGSPLYNMAFGFVLCGDLDPRHFLTAWQTVADESDALRTRLVAGTDGQPHVELHPAGACATTIEVLPEQADGDRITSFFAWAERRCRRALASGDLLGAELVDSALVDLGEDQHGSRCFGWYLNQHHLITDAASTQIVVRAVAEQLRRIESGLAIEAPAFGSYLGQTPPQPSPRQLQRASAHWQMRSEGQNCPLYGVQNVERSSTNRRHSWQLSEELEQRLSELSEQSLASLSPQSSRLAIWSALTAGWLRRVSDQRKIGWHSPVLGRTDEQAHRTPGLFIEMFPWQVEVARDDTLLSLAQRSLAEVQTFLRHAQPGLSAPSAADGANVVLNYFPRPFDHFAGRLSEVRWIHPGEADSVHDLRVQVHDFSGSRRSTVHFDGNLSALPTERWQRALRHFARFVEGALRRPEQRIDEIELLDPEDLNATARLNFGVGRAQTTLASRESTVVDALIESATTWSTEPAVRQLAGIEVGEEITYTELSQRVERRAHALSARGVGAEVPVAVVAQRDLETVVTLLAVLRAGGAFVPIDPRAPTRRRRDVLADCSATLFVAADGSLDDGAAGIEALDGVTHCTPTVLDATDVSHLPLAMPAPGDLAYILYTSGSTGRPKGVEVDHRALWAYLSWARDHYLRDPALTGTPAESSGPVHRPTVPLFTSLAFDLTLTSLFLPLLAGGVLEVHPQPPGQVDTGVADVVARNRADVAKLTPSHLSLLRRLDLRTSKLRLLILGGEDLRTPLARSVSAQLDDRVAIHNEYGPTEAIVGCVVHRYQPAIDRLDSVPIGRPMAGVRVAVLDDQQRPTTNGTPGELWVARPESGLARGYRGAETLTAESFLRLPDGGRWYRTGDRVRLRESRRRPDTDRSEPPLLEFLGRMDRQLKISGRRIEPGEIETALLDHPAISACAVVAHSAGADDSRRREPTFCKRCGLPSNVPRARFDQEGVCTVCHSYDEIRDRAQEYFRDRQDLQRLFRDSRSIHSAAPYDCLMLLSGGKDSSYALCQLVDLGLRVRAFTLDNGFISEGAKENMRRVTEQLGVPLDFATTPAMNTIFRDSLERFSNVCHGCFKTIYTLSTNRALELGIPIVVTGLSRGQMFETRLTEELFRDGRFSPEDVDAAVLSARKVYHRVDDAVRHSLDVSAFANDDVFDRVRYVDFYRYWDVGLDEVLAYLAERVPWVRPEDTGRSTNCLINDAGIWVHRRERRFHNYALPYSWDVRMGHKTRDQALAELHDEIDTESVRRQLLEIGYVPEGESASDLQLGAFFVSTPDHGGTPSIEQLRHHLRQRLPEALVPRLYALEELPLTHNGKVDEAALLELAAQAARERNASPDEERFVAPAGPIEGFLADLWQRSLAGDRPIGAEANFFELGGTSLGAMEVMVELCREFDLDLPLETIFERPVLQQLAARAEQIILGEVAGMSVAEQKELLGES